MELVYRGVRLQMCSIQEREECSVLDPISSAYLHTRHRIAGRFAVGGDERTPVTLSRESLLGTLSLPGGHLTVFDTNGPNQKVMLDFPEGTPISGPHVIVTELTTIQNTEGCPDDYLVRFDVEVLIREDRFCNPNCETPLYRNQYSIEPEFEEGGGLVYSIEGEVDCGIDYIPSDLIPPLRAGFLRTAVGLSTDPSGNRFQYRFKDRQYDLKLCV